MATRTHVGVPWAGRSAYERPGKNR